MAKLWATPADRDRLAAAGSAVLLVGSYDGSGNYGDVLQLAGAIQTVRRAPGEPLPIAILEHETIAHHAKLLRRYPEIFAGAAFVHFDDGRGEAVDGLCELADGAAPDLTVLHLYGGGYLNRWWAGRKIEHCEAAHRLAAGRALQLTASGLQVAEDAIGPAGPAHELLASASWIGLRDASSLEFVNRHLAAFGSPKAYLAGDDAIPFIASADAVDPRGNVNFHLNLSGWISEDAARLEARIVRFLCNLADATDRPLKLQPVVAYEDPRISERAELERFLDRHGDELEAHGVSAVAALDILDDAVRGGLGGFRSAQMTVSCSYHVTLTSLLAGIPAVLLSDNSYYDQKAAGLRDLFGIAPGLIGVRGSAEDARTAAEALSDGPARAEVVAAVGRGRQDVVARHEAAREMLLAAMSVGRERAAFDLGRRRALARAEAAEARLAAVTDSRAWRWVTRMRRARDAVRRQADRVR